MRITGTDASVEYIRRYGQDEEVDRELARMLSEGLIDFDPDTELFTITSLGRVALWETQTADRLDQWESGTTN